MDRNVKEGGFKIYPPQGPRRGYGTVAALGPAYDATHPPPPCAFPEFICFGAFKTAESTGMRYDSTPAFMNMLKAVNYSPPVPRAAQISLPKITRTFDSSTVEYTQEDFIAQLEEYFRAAGATCNNEMKIMKIKDNSTNRVRRQIEQYEKSFMAANNNAPPTWADISTWFRNFYKVPEICLLYTSPSPRDLSTSRMPSSA